MKEITAKQFTTACESLLSARYRVKITLASGKVRFDELSEKNIDRRERGGATVEIIEKIG